MTQSWLRKAELFMILVLILSLTITFHFAPKARAATEILSLTPSSGKIGTSVQVNGTITTENGNYSVKFDGDIVTTGIAEGYVVDATFVVPNTYAAYHNVTLIDDVAVENHTVAFSVLTSYFLEVVAVEPPKQQRQEGDSATINATINGGNSNTSYAANITVQTPTNATYTKTFTVATSDKGNGTTIFSFPDDFLSENPNANTNFTGYYDVFFNATLAAKTFFVGLTNATEYHRFDLVDIKATGYKSDENVTITVNFGGATIHSDSVNATGEGIIYANWTVPSNATIGTYTLNLTSTFGNTTKNPSDIQSLRVPGFDINVTIRNLAGEPFQSVTDKVTVRVYENATSIENKTSSAGGLVFLTLEIGNYTGEAYFRDQKVGEQWINITGVASLDFGCNFTNLRILVKALVDDVEVNIPEAGLFLTPENLTATTNITGIAIFHSLLPNVTYTFNVSRYNTLFNETVIPALLVNENAVAWFDVNITCPTLTLQVNVTNPNAGDQPMSNFTVKLNELMGGIFYEGRTDAQGIAVFNAIFGNYTIEVYEENGIKLVGITTDLFESKNVSVSCSLYGLEVTVKVVDYFWQPIPNALVVLQREGLVGRSMYTQASGVATFDSVVGGNVQITVYLIDQTRPYTVENYVVSTPTTIEIRIEKYVILAGFLIEAIHLITAIIIIATVIFLLSLEVYRRKRRKSSRENEKLE